jgi:hypothetical protein
MARRVATDRFGFARKALAMDANRFVAARDPEATGWTARTLIV